MAYTLERKLKIIHENVSIVDVINRYAPRPIHNNMICCFCHSEKTPSCSINTEINRYYCYACGAKGDVVDAVIKILNVDMQNAIEILGKDFNLQYKRWLSDEEFKEMQNAERERKHQQMKKKEREKFILSVNEHICNNLLWLRRRQNHLYPCLTAKAKIWWQENKQRIRELEDTYLRLNKLIGETVEYTQDEIIEKIKSGQIKI